MRLSDLREMLERDGAAIVIMVAEAAGSTPREIGAAMAAARGGTIGTIGGGVVEAAAIEIAHAMLEGGPATREARYRLGPEIDQCCGGALRLAFRRVTRDEAPTSPFALWEGGPVLSDRRAAPVFLYGAGHVGRAIARALEPLDMALTWIDPRAGAFADVESGARMLTTPLPEASVAEAPPDAAHLVLTHSHAVDLEIVAAILARDFAFAGLIGSASKRALFARRLAERGLPADAIARLTCPIGLAEIQDKRPAVIAASVAAQLLTLSSAP